MPLTKLSMRDIRRHPAAITSPDRLEVGLEVVKCHFIEPIGHLGRAAQALIALTGKETGASALGAMRAGYRHMPAWGIVIDHVATVKNFRENALGIRFIGLDVTQSSRDLPLQEILTQHTAQSLEAVAGLIEDVPLWTDLGIDEAVVNSCEFVMDYGSLGLAPDPLRLNNILLDRSKL